MHNAFIGAVSCIGMLTVSLAAAQDSYPTRPIRIIVANGPGSGADSMARLLSDALRQELNTDILVENKAGASGLVGGDFVAKSKPDGYTIGLFQASVLTTAAAINPKLPYDPIKDFTPLANLGVNPLAVIVSANSRWSTLGDFLSDAKENPGKRSCGIIGTGSHSHFNLELLSLASGTNILRVPYSGGTGDVITGLLGGHIDCASLVWAGISGQVKSGKFRVLAVTSRIKDLPTIPTFAQVGVPRASLEVFVGMFGPARLPRNVLDRLVPAVERSISDPKMVSNMDRIGFTVAYEGPRELAERIEKELVVVRDVAAQTGITQ